MPHHVTQRGNRRQPTFFGEEDYAACFALGSLGYGTIGMALGMGYAAALMVAAWYLYRRRSALAPVFAACGAILMSSIVVETHARFQSLPLVPAYWTLMATGAGLAFVSRQFTVFLPVSVGTLGMSLSGGERRRVEIARASIGDMSADRGAVDRALRELDRLQGAGRSVYVHCMGGLGRTGTVVGSFLVEKGLVPAIEKVGDQFEKMEIYLPELMLAADAMKSALALLLPLIPKGSKGAKATVVIGTVQGDVHEIGKNWVEADADVAEAIDYFEYYGREMLRLARRHWGLDQVAKLKAGNLSFSDLDSENRCITTPPIASVDLNILMMSRKPL